MINNLKGIGAKATLEIEKSELIILENSFCSISKQEI